ncbi:MAG: Zn-ribbon domain-containing OB-fold protein [Acidobacteriota bacterium]
MSSEEELIIYRRSMRIPYRWAAGMTATRFYREIAESKKIYGTRCSNCARVLMPARKSCSRCFRDIDEWVEVGPNGTVQSFTVIHYQEPIHPLPVPLVYALIQLDCADTAFVHIIRGIEASAVRTGMRVTAVFAEQPTGQITDIQYFKPL